MIGMFCLVRLEVTRLHIGVGARCSSVVRVFAYGVMGRRIDPSRWTH